MSKNIKESLNSISSPLKIRTATLDDLDQIYQIENMCFKDAYPYGLLHQLIKDRNAISLVMEIEQFIVGFAFGIMRSGKKGHIISVAVHPKYRNCKYGTKIVAQLISILKEKDAVVIELEVRISNEAAQKLYEKFNFNIEKIRHGYYSDREDAYLMVYKIKK